MSRTETLKRSTAVAHATRLASLESQTRRLLELQQQVSEQVQELREIRAQIPEDLARALMPLAEAMVQLTEETRRTLETVVTQARAGYAEALTQVQTVAVEAEESIKAMKAAATRMEKSLNAALQRAREAAEERRRSRFGLIVTVALLTALPCVASVLWLAWTAGLLTIPLFAR
jgi:signal transduction histidine kinase